VELPFGKKEQFTLSLAGGLAIGLLDANESWKQTVPFSETHRQFTGSGNTFDVLWGGIRRECGLPVQRTLGRGGGVQFQDLALTTILSMDDSESGT